MTRRDVAAPVLAEGRVLLVPVTAMVLVLSVWPVGRLLLALLGPDGLPDVMGLAAELGRPSVALATFRTVEAGLLSGALALMIGTAAALVLAVTDMRGKRAFAFLFAMSMLIAPHVAALAFKTLAGPASPLLGALGLAPAPGTTNPLLGRGGIVLVLGLHHAPLAMLTVLAGLKALPHALVEAAVMDGAGPWLVTRKVVLPLIKGHLVAAGLLCFVAAVGNFGIPALLGLPVNYVTLPTLIYRQLSSFGPSVIADVARYSLLVALIAGLAVLGAHRLLRGGTPLEPGTSLGPYAVLGRWRPLVEGAAAGLILLALVLPFASLLAAGMVRAYGLPLVWETVTARAFVEVLTRQQATLDAFRNSVLFAGTAALLIAAFAVPIAYVLERHAGRWRSLLGFFIELPYALPGVVIAIAAILVFLRPLPLLGVGLYGTAAIILFAYLSRFLAMGLKPVQAALGQFDPSIEEAAALCGAGLWGRLIRVITPNLIPAVAAGALTVFLTAFNELTVSALLWSAKTQTLGVVLYGFEEAGLTSEASALGVITIGVVFTLMLGIDRLGRYLPPGTVPWQIEAAKHG